MKVIDVLWDSSPAFGIGVYKGQETHDFMCSVLSSHT